MTETLQMQEVGVEKLRPNAWNTNHVSPENEEKIKESLSQFGFIRPIIARKMPDGGLEILGGQHRWQVAKRMGYKTVPVIDLGEIDDVKAKKIGLIDNGRYGEDDTLQLAELLKTISEDFEDISSILPYSNDELESIFSASKISLDDLDLDDSDDNLPDLSKAKATQTHQILRFKVPIEDADLVQKAIEQIMKSQGFKDDDSMTNAGNALVYMVRAL